MIYDDSRDMHDSIDVVMRYAMPNLNACYTADDISKTAWEGDYPVCCVCGRSVRPFEVHHEPPRSKGSLLLMTKWGRFVVKPSLLLLCNQCHRDRHDGLLTFDWAWDSEEDERLFLSGWFFAHGYGEHSERFFDHGRIVVTSRGMTWEIRR